MPVRKVPKKFRERVQARLRSFQEIVADQRLRQTSEADTATVVKDLLGEVFGYDKYRELVGEFRIGGAFCDLAVQVEGRTRLLVEIKAAHTGLARRGARQAVNYAAHEGVEWVVLTNACDWRVYRVTFGRPLGYEEILRFQLLDLDPQLRSDLALLHLLSREGLAGDALGAFHRRQQEVNHFTVAQILMSAPMVRGVRQEMRRLFPDRRVAARDIARLLVGGVLTPEVLEGEKVDEARRRIREAAGRRRVRNVARGPAPR